MSANAAVTLDWGDGETSFRLGVRELIALEEKCDRGAVEIYDRFGARRWRVGEAREILRLGLIGAGGKMQDANRMVAKYFDEMNVSLLEHGVFAHAVLAAALSGPAEAGDTEPGKPQAAASETGANASTPLPFMDPEPA